MAHPTDALYGAATIRADGDPTRGRVMMVLVCENAMERHFRFRWHCTDDGYNWQDAGVTAATAEEAHEAAAEAWGDPTWELEFPGEYEA